jgi:phage shock protein A
MQAKKLLKALTQNLANARESRHRWRNEARQLRQQIKSLQEEIEQLKMIES